MARLKAILLFSVLMVLALSVTGLAQRIDTGDSALLGAAVTTTQTMVYAPFVSNIAPEAPAGTSPIRFDTTLVVSNPLAFPGTSSFLVGGADEVGTVELYCYNQDGTLVFFETSMDPTVGSGLSSEGTLGPGQTWTVLFQSVLGAVLGDADARFDGYCYAVGNFDGIAGVSSVLGFGVGFTQTTTMTPAVGQGPTPAAGLPVVVPQ